MISPKERAEKIYRIFSEHQTIDSICIQDIAAQICEAVLEARIEMHEGLVYDEGVAWGRASMREEAAKVAESSVLMGRSKI